MQELSGIVAIVGAAFLAAGLVKGVVGLGLPAVAMALLGLAMPPAEAASLLVVPTIVTNIWQLHAGPRIGAVTRRFATMMVAICAGIPAPTLANMVEGGRTPILPQQDLAEIGYKVVIYPNSLTRVMARAGQRLLEALKRTGTTTGLAADMLTHGELWDLFGRREWEQLEARFVTRRDR